MKQHLYRKLLILYFAIGGICFLLLSSGGSYLVEKKLEKTTGASLYRTASHIASQEEIRQAVKNPDNDQISLALNSAAAFQNADFWIMDTDGTVLINTSKNQIAQLVEQRTENPRVAGSIPALGIIFLSVKRISMCKILFQLQKLWQQMDMYVSSAARVFIFGPLFFFY